MFGKKLNRTNALAIVDIASKDYLKKLIENVPSEDDLEARQSYLVGAFHEAVGIDFLAQYIEEYFGDGSHSLPSASVISNIREMLKHNEDKINS